MALQTAFYIIGIIFMTLTIIILLAIGIVVFLISKKLFELQRHIAHIVERIEYLVKHPEDVALDLGTTAAAGAWGKIKKLFFRKDSAPH